MAAKKTPARKPRKSVKPEAASARPSPGAILRRGVRWLGWVGVAISLLLVVWIAAYRWIDPPTTPYMRAEAARLGEIRQDWVPLTQIAPELARSVVAAEDANFCAHWGFDMAAIRAAIEAGGTRGASTLSQQVVKNAFLWHGRSWPRKALEALMTPVMEALWPKARILEVYLNIAEFDEGVFGVGAAAPWYFGVPASDLSRSQSAALAVVLPNPKARSAVRPAPGLKRRAAQVADGAETIRRDGRAACFED
ncbi:MAG: monofunctional biosynthetic peptidoglycan transglycosylase [Pseudomonadota bacterium]